MTTKIKTDLLKIGWYQIIGGTIGVIVVLIVFGSVPFLELNVVVYVFMLLFFFYSIFCGILCLKNKSNSLIYSLINQILQMMGFAVLGFAFTYTAGVYVSIGFDLTNSVQWQFSMGFSKFDFNIGGNQDRTEINFNLVAFVLIYWIDKLMKKNKVEKDNLEIESVGQ